jgi:polyisoprenoid-binding protein YceI
MTNYSAPLALVTTLFATLACGAEQPPAAAASPVAHYVQSPSGSSLAFTFSQAGADNAGSFKQFVTLLDYDEKNLAASHFQVTVQIASMTTEDKDRDSTLAGADFFDTQKFATAQYVATSLAKGAGGVEAVGKLTLRGVTKDLRVPLTIKTTATGLELSGETTLKRLDYGVGQGEWKSTEWVGDDVKLTYRVNMVKAPAAAR